MPDIEKINVNGEIYDLVDTEARANSIGFVNYISTNTSATQFTISGSTYDMPLIIYGNSDNSFGGMIFTADSEDDPHYSTFIGTSLSDLNISKISVSHFGDGTKKFTFTLETSKYYNYCVLTPVDLEIEVI